MEVVLGPKWLIASEVFRGLSFFVLASPLLTFFRTILQSAGSGRALIAWGAVSMVSMMICVLIGLPWGINGIAYSFSILGLLFRAPILFYLLRRYCHLQPKALLAPAMPFVLMFIFLVLSGSIVRYYATSLGRPLFNLAAHSSLICLIYMIWAIKSGRFKIALQLFRK